MRICLIRGMVIVFAIKLRKEEDGVTLMRS